VQDEWSNIYENYSRLQAAIGCSDRNRCWVHQMHGGDVVRCDGTFESGAKADAMTTTDPSRLLSVRVADCVPILVASSDGKRVAAVHAGWRGVLAGAVANAVKQLDSTPSEVSAAIGPCIGFDRFEVGAEVLDAFSAAFGETAPLVRRDNGKGRVDLARAIELQLRRVGVSKIDRTDRCTFTHRDEFFSHRRDRGFTGRMAAMIGPRCSELRPTVATISR
jgi:YfiH family protein